MKVLKLNLLGLVGKTDSGTPKPGKFEQLGTKK